MGVGVHLLLDLYGVARERLTDTDLLRQALRDAAAAAGMTPLSEPVLHTFPGGGLTGFLPLAESHIAFHSYPELEYIAMDCFTCGDPEGVEKAQAVFWQALRPMHAVAQGVIRGEDVDG
jgi:S-adenosylmethionine decarboxylase